MRHPHGDCALNVGPIEELSKRQAEVIERVAKGLPDKDCAGARDRDLHGAKLRRRARYEDSRRHAAPTSAHDVLLRRDEAPPNSPNGATPVNVPVIFGASVVGWYCTSNLRSEANPRELGSVTARSSAERNRSNLLAAIERSLSSADYECAARLASALFWFWFHRGHWREGRMYLGQIVGLFAQLWRDGRRQSPDAIINV